MPLILPARTLDSSYEISNSLRCDIDSSGTLTKTNSGAGNQRTWTFSCWVKRSVLRSSGARTIFGTTDGDSDSLRFQSDGLNFFNNGSADSNLSTNRLFRDVSAWYHIVLAFDTTQGTAANRVKLYINGSQYTWDNATTYPDQNYQGQINDASNIQSLNKAHNAAELAGYIAEAHLTDGTAYAASDFGETNDNGVWVPKKASVSYGTNGYYFEFKQTGTSADASGMGADTSGNTNHFAVSNLTATDITTDTPTNNFCTVNPLMGADASARFTFTEGNTVITHADNGNWRGTGSTFALTSGKWYWEVQNAASASNKFKCFIGVIDASIDINNDTSFNLPASTLWYNHNNGEINKDGSYTTADYGGGSSGSPIGVGDTLGVLLNMDDNQIGFYKNGSALVENYSLSTNISVAMPFFASDDSGDTFKINFGNPAHTISSGNADANGYGNFEFSVPSNYYSLCTKNLAEYG